MVAASKLRYAQDQAHKSDPYAQHLAALLRQTEAQQALTDLPRSRMLRSAPPREDGARVLLLVVTSDRGLCGAFNGMMVREARRRIAALESSGAHVQLLCLGRKGRDQLRRVHGAKMLALFDDKIPRRRVELSFAEGVAAALRALFEAGEVDEVHAVFGHFKSAIAQVVTWERLLPISVPSTPASLPNQENGDMTDSAAPEILSEPNLAIVLDRLAARFLAARLYGILVDSAVSEQSARTMAMDNATRNAGEMIDRLTLVYNRSRQAAITRELVEIISGAEAL